MRFKHFLTATLLITNCGMAHAQESDPGIGMAEITVTAQKREQSLQDVGISISAIDGETLNALGMDNSNAVSSMTPNFNIQSITGEGNQPAFFVRGVGLNDYNTNNAGPVAIYQDGAIVSSPSAQTFALFDVERVEVLRGPQGTLYGRNATGGTINFITNKPTDSLQGRFELAAGNYNLIKTEGAISGPLSDQFRARFAFMTTDADGYATDTVTGKEYNELGNRAVRLLLDWTPSDNVAVLANLRWGKHKTIRPVYKHFGAFDANTFDPNTGLFGGFCSAADVLAHAPFCVDALGYQDTSSNLNEGQYNRDGDLDFETRGVTIQLDWDVNGSVKFTSITSYDDLDKMDVEDSDAAPLSWLHVNFGVDSETISQELRLNIDTERSSWVLGAYYLDEELNQNQGVDLFRDLRPIFGFDPNLFIITSEHLHKQKTTAAAVFGQVDFMLSDRLTAVAGVRFTSEEKTFNADVRLVEPAFDIPLWTVNNKIDDDNVSGKLGLNFFPNDDWMVYGSVTSGFKSGGFPGVFALTDPSELDPFKAEEIISYEVGFKSTFADGNVRFNGAIFLYDYEDLQLYQLFGGTGIPIQRLTNAADAEVRGAEFELTATPVDGLYLQAGLGILDTDLKNFQPAPGLDLSGNSMGSAPELTANLLARYDWPLRNGSLYVQGDVVYQDDVFFDAFNTEITAQDAYTLVGARAGFLSQDERWEISVWGKNLSDEQYLTFMLDLSPDFGLYQGIAGAPRTYGASLSYRFE